MSENIAKPKELWKCLKSLGLPSKNSTPPNICLKKADGNVSFDPKENAETFKSFFSNLAKNLVEKLPIPTK